MMKKETSRNIRLGIMVVTGIIFLVTALYFIGDKQNLFGSTIKIKASFTNVNGLAVGNNVRYVGIDVGTVYSIQIENDSTVIVEMTIESDAVQYIRKNAVATIGTDGLMGNKLVNIHSVSGKAKYIEEGDIIATIAPLETEEIMRTLSQTNDDMYLIAENLKSITEKIEEENMIWNLLRDTVIANNLRRTMVNVEHTSSDLTHLTTSFKGMVKNIEKGEGIAGSIIYDDTFMLKVDKTLTNLQGVTDSLSRLSSDITEITGHVKKGEGAAGKVLMDPKFEQDLNETLVNVKNASKSLEENMEALKHSILLRKYYKKKAKEK